MTRGNRYKTIRWRFVESLEPPRVVHARCPDMVSKGNLYGQVTVRMHSKQVQPTFHCKSVFSLSQVVVVLTLSSINWQLIENQWMLKVIRI